jgi:hypothetical protein
MRKFQKKPKHLTTKNIYDYLSCGDEFQKHRLQCK